MDWKKLLTATFLGMILAPAAIWAAPLETAGQSPSLAGSLAAGDLLYSYAMAYGLGILAALTPCILPMIPIVLAIFGANNETSRKRNFLLSFVYVQGMATLYTILGLVAVFAGSVFGAHNANPFLIGFLVITFIYLGLVFGEHTAIPIPRFIQNFQQKNSRIGYLPAYGLGLVSGFVAASCAAPAYFVILDQIRARAAAAPGDALLFGFTMSYIFALGIGTLFIGVAAFGVRLPRSGNWQTYLKKGGALVLFTTAFFYLTTLLPFLKTESIIAALGITGDSFILPLGFSLPPGLFFLAIVGIILLAMAWLVAPVKGRGSQPARLSGFYALGVIALFFLGSASVGLEPASAGKITWANHCSFRNSAAGFSDRQALLLFSGLNKNAASPSGIKDELFISQFMKKEKLQQLPKCIEQTVANYQAKPLMLDFWADWCRECKVLEQTLLRRQKVAQKLESFHLVKIDVTDDTPEQKALMKQFGVQALPTLKFVDRAGNQSPEQFRGSSISEHAMLHTLDRVLQAPQGNLVEPSS